MIWVLLMVRRSWFVRLVLWWCRGIGMMIFFRFVMRFGVFVVVFGCCMWMLMRRLRCFSAHVRCALFWSGIFLLICWLCCCSTCWELSSCWCAL